MDDYARLIDPARTICLCSEGEPDYIATVSVDRDGNEVFWLAHRDRLGDDDADCGNERPYHERVGRLPQAVRDRIWGDALRCGRPTYGGRPCRHRVAEPGQACGVHGGAP